MPYIKSNNDRREKLRNGEPALTAGELNYQIFYYVKHNYSILQSIPHLLVYNQFEKQILDFTINFLIQKISYQRYDEMMGCLVLCHKEIKRRLNINLKEMFNHIIDSYDDEITKYEDQKILENGDVE